MTRLEKEHQRLLKAPVALAAAAPRNDLMLWDAAIGVELEGRVWPVHFLISFPDRYPLEPPNAGFSFHFPYTLGASHTETKGALKGKMVICLDLLGNYSAQHADWKDKNYNSGWTPSCSVTTVLVQLQVILAAVDWTALSHAQRDQLKTQAAKPEVTRLLPLPLSPATPPASTEAERDREESAGGAGHKRPAAAEQVSKKAKA